MTGSFSRAIKRFDPHEGPPAKRSLTRAKTPYGAEAMRAHPRPLIEVPGEIPDFRHNRGKRHPLTAMLALACSAMLCGYRSYKAIADWGRNYGAHLMRALGFTHQPPVPLPSIQSCAVSTGTCWKRRSARGQRNSWWGCRHPRTPWRALLSMARHSGGVRSKGLQARTSSKP